MEGRRLIALNMVRTVAAASSIHHLKNQTWEAINVTSNMSNSSEMDQVIGLGGKSNAM